MSIEHCQVLVPPGRAGEPVMIDFERSKSSERPKNVTQFCEFVNLPSIRALLEPKQIKARLLMHSTAHAMIRYMQLDRQEWRELAKKYARSGRSDDEGFAPIIQTLHNALKATELTTHQSAALP